MARPALMMDGGIHTGCVVRASPFSVVVSPSVGIQIYSLASILGGLKVVLELDVGLGTLRVQSRVLIVRVDGLSTHE